MKNRWVRLGGVLGIAYCVAGFFLVFLGWNGAASHDTVAAQMPYLVSGGIGGLALVVVGAGLIVAQSLRTDRVELRGAIDDLRESIERIAADEPGARAGGGPSTTAGDDAVLAGPTSYHRSACRLVHDQSGVVTMLRTEAIASGRTPCRICSPEAPTLTAAS